MRFYVIALQNQPFNLHYADAFAGTGSHSPASLESQDILIPYEDFKGSVEVTLSVEPAFHQYHFNDLNPAHILELETIKDQHPHKAIGIYHQDANAFVPEFCSSLRGRDRAVLFLDPYSTQLDWSTLEHVAATEKVDLWLLFPISVILRMTPRDGDRIRPEWRETLNRLLGTDKWEAAFSFLICCFQSGTESLGPGCKHCYAETMARRLQAMGAPGYENGFKLSLVPERLNQPLIEALGRLKLNGVHWVIVGGESGHGARPMKEEWALSIRDQCELAGVDFFFKQWGAWGEDGKLRNKKANGRTLDGRVWDMIPTVAMA